MDTPDLTTTHKLAFESGYNELTAISGAFLFRVGTCHGQYGALDDSYYILSVMNKEIGNGHLDDVFEWFEYSCKREGKNLLVLECFNSRFYNHLLSKRGFIALDKGQENCIKVFNQSLYKKLLKHGNEILIKGSLKCI